MSLAEIQEAASRLPDPEQRELTAFLVELRIKLDSGIRHEWHRRMSDTSPDGWVSLPEAKA